MVIRMKEGLKKELLNRYKQKTRTNKINKETFDLIIRLTEGGLNNFELAYSIADEIIANRKAILTLDDYCIILKNELTFLRRKKGNG